MPPSHDAAYRHAAEALYSRLLVFRRFAVAASEREDDEVTLQRRELWESADEQALRDFENARHAMTGAVPLPMECA